MKDAKPTEYRKCPKCNETKIIEGNYCWTKRDGWYTYCNDCLKAKNKLRTSEIRRKWHIKAKYGIEYNEFEEMIKKQEGKCKICESDLELRTGGFAVDHSHSTGGVRSLLCTSCNTVLGHAKDNISVLEKMIVYLKHHNSSHVNQN